MANPTRAEILADVALPTFRISVWNGVSYDIINNDEIESVSGDIDSNGKDNGLSFGDAVIISAQVVFADTVTLPTNWRMAKTRIEVTYNGADWMPVFYGYITSKQRTGRSLTITCGGIDSLIEEVKIFSGVRYRRPIASKTTSSSVEDPTNVAYVGGAINEIFWKAGGRPYDQAGSYPNATFYYACDQSLIQPEWIWFSGENLLEELYMLARAGGGQIYQGASDIIRYVQPFTFANGSTTLTLDDAYYGEITQTEISSAVVGTIRGVYTPRYLQGYQIVYQDETAKLVKASETKTIECRTELPIYLYQSQTADTMFTGVDWNADPVIPTLNSATYTSQKVTLQVTNGSASPMVINSIKLHGRPVVAGEKGYVSYGSGSPERNLEDNPYVQSEAHATILARMVYDFYVSKPVVTLTGCGYDPDRIVGELVGISSAYYTISGVYRIVGISYDLGALDMSLKVVDVSGLIKRSDIFIAGTTYAAGDTRKVSY